MKVKSVILTEIMALEKKLIKLQAEYENCNYAPKERELAISISNCQSDLSAHRRLLKEMEVRK